MTRQRSSGSLPLALLLAACILVSATAQNCVSWRGTLGRTESDEYVGMILDALDPYFSGTLFLPPEPAFRALLAANASLTAPQLLQYHLAPSLRPTDSASPPTTPLVVRTLLDSNDAPTICPPTQLTETTLTYLPFGAKPTVNGVPAEVSEAQDTCEGHIVSISDVLLPRCLNLEGTVAAPCRAPSTVKALAGMKQIAAGLLAKLLPSTFQGTVFVPSDAALKALFTSLSLPFPPTATSPNATAFLKDIALYHAVPSTTLNPPTAAPPAATLTTSLAAAPSQSLCRTPPPATLKAAGPPLAITPASGPAVSPTATDATATCRGVIYTIDSVLLPCTLDKTWLVAPVPVPNPSPPPAPSPSIATLAPPGTRTTTIPAPSPTPSAAPASLGPLHAQTMTLLAVLAAWFALAL